MWPPSASPTCGYDLLAEHGFAAVTLGPRVLRSDSAVVSLVSLAHETLHRWDQQAPLG